MKDCECDIHIGYSILRVTCTCTQEQAFALILVRDRVLEDERAKINS